MIRSRSGRNRDLSSPGNVIAHEDALARSSRFFTTRLQR
jgi:hypothetical protein